jgi:hypothetical protein
MKGLNNAMQGLTQTATGFASTMVNQAKQVFGDVSGLFNSVTASLGKIVAGGPGQQGWGAAETSAVNSQIINNAATSARNEKAAAGNAVSAIGGGNTVNPSGLATAINLQTNQAVEATKSQQEEAATVANYQQGNQNYFNAITGEMQAPSMFNAVTNMDTSATGSLKQATATNQAAQQSQTAMDASSGWWKKDLMAGAGVGLDMISGGLGGTALTDALSDAAEIGSGIVKG